MEKSIRRSRKRDAILTALKQSHSHPSAESLYHALKREIPDLSLGTVYRNLSRFRQDGEAVSVGVVDGQERYDGNVEPHTHFVCSLCGTVSDMHNVSPNAELSEKARDLYGFDVKSYKLVFYGFCKNCKA